MLTSDFHHFRLLDRIAQADRNDDDDADGPPPIGSVIEFDLGDLPDHADRLQVLAGYEADSPTATQAEVSVQASKLMGELYEAMSGADLDDHDASVFLIRVLFCLFADDAQMEGWPRNIFERYIKTQTAESGQDVGALLTRLFRRLDRSRDPGRPAPADELLATFPCVDGDIFAERIEIPEFDKKMRHVLLKCCAFNWANISPAIFGSLFQTVKDRRARREMGEHYTTETNIMRLIGPMFLDGLTARFEKERDSAKGLRALRRDLGAMRFLDPACGCGNFLVVAYRELRALELRILERLQYLQGIGAGGRTASTSFDLSLIFDEEALEVKASHFFGIEIEEWPAQIARTALHLADHQANLAMIDALGRGPATLPLTKINTITQANALRIDWAKIVPPTNHLYIMGNPPFLGMNTRSARQIEDLDIVWGE